MGERKERRDAQKRVREVLGKKPSQRQVDEATKKGEQRRAEEKRKRDAELPEGSKFFKARRNK